MSSARAEAASVGAEISAEHFIPDHVFVYIVQGALRCYDGHRSYVFRSGECFLARKNRLARYNREAEAEAFENIILCFDEKTLRDFEEKHRNAAVKTASADTFIPLSSAGLLPGFIQSWQRYQASSAAPDSALLDLKYEELLIILLQEQPALAGVLLDFAAPQKINLEAFMNRHYSFNVRISRFAHLTGRSLSAFKRDFSAIFGTTPARWLVQRRLQEAHFLIEKKGRKASDIYLDLGFENLSHFSFAFKKRFGYSPTGVELVESRH